MHKNKMYVRPNAYPIVPFNKVTSFGYFLEHNYVIAFLGQSVQYTYGLYCNNLNSLGRREGSICVTRRMCM